MQRAASLPLPLLLLATLLPVGAGATGTCGDTPDFTDSCYHEHVLHVWDTPTLDVLVLPPASPYIVRDTALVEDAIDAWTEGVEALGASWLVDGLSIRPHVLGQGLPPTAVVRDAEIVVATAEVNPNVQFGIGLQDPLGVCAPGGFASLSGPHRHEGSSWTVQQATCDDGGYRCLVLTTNILWIPDLDNARDMQDLSAHEFGHCLGLGHVGDASDFTATAYPNDDIMGYESDGHEPDHVLCVSSLNVRVLEGIFARVLGRPASEWLDPGDYLHMDPADYTQVDCPDAAPPPLTATPRVGAPLDGQGGCTVSGKRNFAACGFTCVPGTLYVQGTAAGAGAVFRPGEGLCGSARASCYDTNPCNSNAATTASGAGTCQARVKDPLVNDGWTLRCWTVPDAAGGVGTSATLSGLGDGSVVGRVCQGDPASPSPPRSPRALKA